MKKKKITQGRVGIDDLKNIKIQDVDNLIKGKEYFYVGYKKNDDGFDLRAAYDRGKSRENFKILIYVNQAILAFTLFSFFAFFAMSFSNETPTLIASSINGGIQCTNSPINNLSQDSHKLLRENEKYEYICNFLDMKNGIETK